MTDFDHTSLDRVLPGVAGSADWDDVMNRARGGQGGRRRQRLVVLAAIALVAMVSASAFAMRAFLGERGYVGLPPKGATPSTPKTGTLVLDYWVVTPETVSNPRRVKAWLYADGRLVWQRENDPHQPRPPEAANRWSSGLVEQRLTRAGVERFRSELVSTGLFTRNRDLVLEGEIDPCFNFIDVRNGGKLVAVTWTNSYCAGRGDTLKRTLEPATPEQASALRRLKPQLSDPTSWLPARAWKQREFKAFVPSRFAIGLWSGQPSKLSRILAQLPTPVRDALRGLDWKEQLGSPTAGVSTKEARVLATALEAAGLTKKRGAFRLSYRFENPDSGKSVEILFGPLLPHGEEPGYGG